MTNYQRTKRRATLISALIASSLYLLILFGPAIGGYITAEQPTSYSAQR